MSKDNIKKELIDLLSRLFINSGFDVDIVEYMDFINDGGMDSLTFISMVIEIEEYFNIIIPDDLLLPENFKFVDGIVSIIDKELSKNSGI